MGSLTSLLNALHPDQRKRGREFERICKWYLESEPRYADQLCNVWLWDDWPGRWGSDAGIDLIAEHRDGTIWAVQAKAYDPRYRVTKEDIDTFLSESGRPEIGFRLLIATTNRISHHGWKTLTSQEKHVSMLQLSDLEESSLDWPTTPSELRPHRPPKKSPLPHSIEAIENVVKGFQTSDRGQLLMACGTGKTLVGLWVAERLASTRTVVLVPSLSLLSQTLREWADNAQAPFRYLLVCSDESAADEDHLTQHTSELGIPTTTNVDVIRQFLACEEPCVVFCTYQSSLRLAEAFTPGIVGFDLAIADEAHRTAGPVTTFATILHNDKLPARRRLFMTATPRIFSNRDILKARDAEIVIASMDDEMKFGPVFHKLSFGDAIERELLAPYQVAIVGVSDESYRQYTDRATLVAGTNIEITDARSLAGQIAVVKALGKYDIKRMVTFHSRVARAKRFSDTLPGVVEWMPVEEQPSGAVWSCHVSGEMATGERSNRLNRLRTLGASQRGVISNARCLGEGVDLPALDGVAFIEPKSSPVEIVQAVGRAIRKSDEKAVSTILLPVFIGDTEDPDSKLNSGAFKDVWTVIRALCSHDETLAAELTSIRRSLGRLQGHAVLPGRISLDLPVDVGDAFIHAFRLRLIKETTSSWEYAFGLLEQYVEREGTSLVPQAHLEDGYRLGFWIGAQRNKYAANTLSADHRNRLERLPGWTWNAVLDTWLRRFALLQDYVRRTGTSKVPLRYRREEREEIGTWVTDQRVLYKRRALSQFQIDSLEALPHWTWDIREDAWEANFKLLRDFALRHGHTKIPADEPGAGSISLRSWATSQRRKRREGQRLSPDRIKRLEAIPGWDWGKKATAEPYTDDRQDAKWREDFEVCVAWMADNPGREVPNELKVGDLNLFRWVSWQRKRYRQGLLTEERISQLESLEGWAWSVHDRNWALAYERLKAYAAESGHGAPPTGFIAPDGFGLGEWVMEQRTACRQGRLRKERIEALQSVPGWAWQAPRRSRSRT